MSKKSSLLIAAVVGAVLIIAVLFGVLSRQGDTPEISMPSPTSELGGSDAGLISVNPETVQTAISTLARQEAYTREYAVTTYWENGSTESTVKVWQNGDKVKIASEQGNTFKNTLFLDGKVYIWYDDDTASVFTAEYDKDNSRLYDRSARLMYYEELLSIDPNLIVDAGYVKKSGENCIFAEYLSEDEVYINYLYVSVSSGLLVAAEIFEGEDMTYSMEATSTSLTPPESDIFIPPVT